MGLSCGKPNTIPAISGTFLQAIYGSIGEVDILYIFVFPALTKI